MQIRHEPRVDELRLCRDCRWSRAASHAVWGQREGEWRNECTHPEVIASHPDVLANWQMSGMTPAVLCTLERARRRPGTACGVGARAWEGRD